MGKNDAAFADIIEGNGEPVRIYGRTVWSALRTRYGRSKALELVEEEGVLWLRRRGQNLAAVTAVGGPMGMPSDPDADVPDVAEDGVIRIQGVRVRQYGSNAHINLPTRELREAGIEPGDRVNVEVRRTERWNTQSPRWKSWQQRSKKLSETMKNMF